MEPERPADASAGEAGAVGAEWEPRVGRAWSQTVPHTWLWLEIGVWVGPRGSAATRSGQVGLTCHGSSFGLQESRSLPGSASQDDEMCSL